MEEVERRRQRDGGRYRERRSQRGREAGSKITTETETECWGIAKEEHQCELREQPEEAGADMYYITVSLRHTVVLES